MTVFVVLHYNSIPDTEFCINSILSKLSNEKIKIIVVDNKSPNNSGKTLKEKYSEIPIVTVILNDKNSGFSKGNNIGCQYAINNYSPDFICILNNDTYIDDTQFVRKLYTAYNKESFDALGPKIWNIKRHYNQNPFAVISSLEEVDRTILFYKKASRYLYSKIPISYYFYCKYFSKKQNNSPMGLNGAAVIFSKQYYQKFSKLIPEVTFMFGEENFLNYRRIRYNLKYIFDFNIIVYHNHSLSTRNLYKSVVEKWEFQHKNILESLLRLQNIYVNNIDI
jgi:GT2 family glycosyltransferase